MYTLYNVAAALSVAHLIDFKVLRLICKALYDDNDDDDTECIQPILAKWRIRLEVTCSYFSIFIIIIIINFIHFILSPNTVFN